MIPKIKICGITREEDAILCEELGVEYIGLNFVPRSPRCITIEKAKELRSSLQNTIPVAVFENEDTERALALAKEIGCTHLQFHGEEDLDAISLLPCTSIKAFRNIPGDSLLKQALACADFVMLDGKRNGQSPDFEQIENLPQHIQDRLFLAGGLTPENVSGVVKKIRPFAVDTASGTESSPGIKDHEKIRAFVSAVRSLSPHP